MARSLSSISILARLSAVLENAVDGSAQSADVNQGFALSPATALTSGTTANKADRVWSDTGRTILSGANDDIDLYDLGTIDIGGGAGKDALGQSVALAEVVALLIYNQPGSAGGLLVFGEGSTSAWNGPTNGSDTAVFGPIRPGGWLMLFAPTDPAYAVTDAASNLLRLTASGGNVTYDISVLGRSA